VIHRRTFMVKVDLLTTTGLKSGMFASPADKGVSQTTVIPKSALVERGELTGVFVVSADNACASPMGAGRPRSSKRQKSSPALASASESFSMDSEEWTGRCADLNTVKAPTNP
jgi:hypothetical protein